MTRPATSEDIQKVLGDIDPFIVERVLETRATVDEIVEALGDLEDERQRGELSDPESTRVAEVRSILAEIPETDDEDEHRS